jgi:hypothetical protein
MASAINAQPWDPPPDMVKRECPECRYLFAALPDSEESPAPQGFSWRHIEGKGC